MSRPVVRFSNELADFDFGSVHGWLTNCRWCLGIDRATVERAFGHSTLVAGAFVDGRQVGVARALSDTARFGYIADVYVDESWRGRGIARGLVRSLVEHPGHGQVAGWFLLTKDAHGVYAGAGFRPFDFPERLMVHRPAEAIG